MLSWMVYTSLSQALVASLNSNTAACMQTERTVPAAGQTEADSPPNLHACMCSQHKDARAATGGGVDLELRQVGQLRRVDAQLPQLVGREDVLGAAILAAGQIQGT